DDRGRMTRTTEARDKRRGIPQGSPISPLLANLYMRRSQFHLEGAAVMRGAEQNGLRFECEPRLPVFQDLLDNVPCLIRFIAHADQLGPLGGAALRPKVLSKALFGEINHSVCRRQDRLRGTIILIKRNDFRRGAELTGEVENISHRRSAERI